MKKNRSFVVFDGDKYYNDCVFEILKKRGECKLEKYFKDNIYLLVSSIGDKKFDTKVCKLLRKVGFGHVGLSVLGGMVVNIEKTVKNIRSKTFDHYCGDIPDINWNVERFKYDLEMVNRDKPQGMKLDLWARYFKRMFLQMIAWRFFSVRNKDDLKCKIKKLLKYTTCIKSSKWIRWDSRGLVENLDMIDCLPEEINVLVEYYPELHTPMDFVKLIQDLNIGNGRKFWISFDAGHFHRARSMYKCCENVEAEKWLMRFVLDPKIARLVRMIEISNLPKDGHNAHASVYDGIIDFRKIFSMVGWAIRNDRISIPFFLVLEASPLSWKELESQTYDNFKKYLKALTDDKMFLDLKDSYG